MPCKPGLRRTSTILAVLVLGRLSFFSKIDTLGRLRSRPGESCCKLKWCPKPAVSFSTCGFIYIWFATFLFGLNNLNVHSNNSIIDAYTGKEKNLWKQWTFGKLKKILTYFKLPTEWLKTENNFNPRQSRIFIVLEHFVTQNPD